MADDDDVKEKYLYWKSLGIMRRKFLDFIGHKGFVELKGSSLCLGCLVIKVELTKSTAFVILLPSVCPFVCPCRDKRPLPGIHHRKFTHLLFIIQRVDST